MKWALYTAGLGAVVAIGLYEWSVVTRAAAHRLARANFDVVLVSHSLRKLPVFCPACLTGPIVSNLNASILYQLLTSTNGDGGAVLTSRRDWDAHRAITDPWGKPINVRIVWVAGKSSTNMAPRAMVTIWSCGPNLRNEGGLGDDITDAVTVDLSEAPSGAPRARPHDEPHEERF